MSKALLRTVTLADLNKAFERVAVQWILLVLSSLQVPFWFFTAVAFFLTGRRSKFRIGKVIIGIIRLLAGLDMGNGLSPFSFCLAVDPLLWLLGNTPGIDIIKAYMDDLQIGASTDKARSALQGLLLRFARASGLLVTRHSCFTRIYRNGRQAGGEVPRQAWQETAPVRQTHRYDQSR